MLVGSLSVLAACAGSIKSIDGGPQLDSIPNGLTNKCARPIVLPDRALTQAEVESYWLRDRANLVACGLSRDAILEWYEKRDALISGSPQA